MTWLFIGLWVVLSALAMLLLATVPTTERASNREVVLTVAAAGVVAGLVTLVIAGLVSII